MPTYKVTDRETGLVLKLTGESPPTEAELIEIFDKENAKRQKIQDTAAAQEALHTEDFVPFGQALSPDQRNGVSPTTHAIREAVGTVGTALTTPIEVLDKVGIVGATKATGALISGALIEPVAGLGGIAASAAEGVPEGIATVVSEAKEGKSPLESIVSGIYKAFTSGSEAGEKTIKDIREALTYVPGKEGQEALQIIGKNLEPIIVAADTPLKRAGEAVTILGVKAGLPPEVAAIAGTIAYIAPQAAYEYIGLKGGLSKGALSDFRKGKKILKATKKAITHNAPDIKKLKEAATALYESLEKSKVTIKKKSYNTFINELTSKLAKEGLDKRNTKKSYNVLQRIIEEKRKMIGRNPNRSLSDVLSLKKMAKDASNALDSGDARLGTIIVSEIDDFLGRDSRAFKISKEGLPKNKAIKGVAKIKGSEEIGRTLEAASDLYGRYKRSEIVNEAVENAILSSSGLEAGLKGEFAKLLRNEKKMKFFKQHEIDAIKAVATRSKGRNAARALGKLGFSEGNVLGILAGGALVTSGKVVQGAGLPVIGNFAKKLVNKMTKTAAERAQLAIRAGREANKIIGAYLRSVPEASRSVGDLSELLLKIDLNDARGIIIKKVGKLPGKVGIIKESIDLAKGKKALRLLEAISLGSLGAPGAIEVIKPKQEDTK